MKFLTKYDHANPESPCGDVSMTQQQYRDECDIDIILKRYRAGEPLPVVQREGMFGDFSEVGDFDTCLRRVNNAVSDFNALPSAIRDRFGSDPSAFYRFALDPANIEECRRLGLAKPAPVVEKPVTADKAAEPALNGEGKALTT